MLSYARTSDYASGMDRFWLMLASINGLLAVAAGAFGAHGLKKIVGPEALAVFETAARYHMYHALALLAVAVAAERWRSATSASAGWAFLIGILIFSGTLYALGLSDMRHRWLGAITPIGGLALMAGWALLAITAWRAAPTSG